MSEVVSLDRLKGHRQPRRRDQKPPRSDSLS